MLEIYYVDDPSPLAEKIYPEFMQIGELTREDIRSLMSNIGKVTYSEHFINLLLNLRVVDEVDESNNLVLAQNIHEDIRTDDTGAMLFDLLTRLSHFARWVTLTQDRAQSDIDSDDIVPLGERGSKMRRARPQRFQGWAQTIDEVATDISFDELCREFTRSRSIIWDHYLDYNNSKSPLEPAVLLIILGAAINSEGSLKIDDFADMLEVDQELVHELITEYLIPVGVPITCESNVASLTDTTEFYVSRPTRILSRIESLLSDSEVSFDTVSDLSDYLGYHTGLLTYTGPASSKDATFILSPNDKQTVQSGVETNVELTEITDGLYPSNTAQYVAVPPDSSLLQDDSFLLNFLESMSTAATDPTISRSAQYFLRKQFTHSGAIPLLTPPEFTTVTNLGDKFANQTHSNQMALFRDLLLVRNPLCRALVATTDLTEAKVRFNSDEWTVNHHNDTYKLIEFVSAYLQQKSIHILDQPDVETIPRTIDFLTEAGLISTDNNHTRLYITGKFDKQLKKDEYRTRELFEKTKREIRSIHQL